MRLSGAMAWGSRYTVERNDATAAQGPPLARYCLEEGTRAARVVEAVLADQTNLTKKELAAEIDVAWMALQDALAGLSDAEMTSVLDAQGWTVKDHLTHLAAWEESVQFFLQGRPRYEALGVDEQLYSAADFDDINRVVRQRRQHLSLDQARTQLDATHRRLMGRVELLSDADLNQPVRHFLPTSSADDLRKAIDIVRDNTSSHFSEHLEWILSLVGRRD